MDGALINRMKALTGLSQDDCAALKRVTTNIRDVASRADLIREGAVPVYIHLVLKGWACRYKTLPNGRRSILSFFIPGDFCDPNVHLFREMDHSIAAITNLRVAQIPRTAWNELMSNHPPINHLLWWHELVNCAVQREWTHNLAVRSAYERLAHLFAEIFLRLRSIDLTTGDSCDFPPTQGDLADATGLTAVHVNRILQELRADGLIELERKRLRIPDLPRLMDAAMFNPNYLHLEGEGAHLNANA